MRALACNRLAVHPHACGGDFRDRLTALHCVRYIPTPVGRLSGARWTSWACPVHPHACGEIAHKTRRKATWHGTSPRLWGDSLRPHDQKTRLRYIPTPVGRLSSLSRILCMVAVHPHACGEIHALPVDVMDFDGTSPRLWGDSLRPHDQKTRLRYIPTPVGRLSSLSRILCMVAVHPHACGEIHALPVDVMDFDGTSPRLWGDFTPDESLVWDTRYIPTPVGRLADCCVMSPVRPVHPHACGEIGCPVIQRTIHIGTSPRLWGDS